jgi:hypothetical protein
MVASGTKLINSGSLMLRSGMDARGRAL